METAVHHGPAPKGDNSIARAETDEAGEVFLETAQILQDQRHFQPPPDFQRYGHNCYRLVLNRAVLSINSSRVLAKKF